MKSRIDYNYVKIYCSNEILKLNKVNIEKKPESNPQLNLLAYKNVWKGVQSANFICLKI